MTGVRCGVTPTTFRIKQRLMSSRWGLACPEHVDAVGLNAAPQVATAVRDRMQVEVLDATGHAASHARLVLGDPHPTNELPLFWTEAFGQCNTSRRRGFRHRRLRASREFFPRLLRLSKKCAPVTLTAPNKVIVGLISLA